MQFMNNEMLMKAEIWCWSEAFRNNKVSMLMWYLAIKIYQFNTHYKDRESASRIRSKYENEFFSELQGLKNAQQKS